ECVLLSRRVSTEGLCGARCGGPCFTKLVNDGSSDDRRGAQNADHVDPRRQSVSKGSLDEAHSVPGCCLTHGIRNSRTPQTRLALQDNPRPRSCTAVTDVPSGLTEMVQR